MLSTRGIVATLGLASLAAAQVPAAGEAGGVGLAIRARKLLTCAVDGPQAIDDGVVWIEGGKIVGVGRADELEVPAHCAVLDVGERWLCPGFIDLHCHVAGRDFFSGNDLNDVIYVTQPEQRASAGVIPANPALQLGLAGGVTTVLFIPGSGSNCGGQGILLKTGLEHFEAARVRDPGSLKVAQWGNPENWGVGVGKTFENWHLRQMFRQGAGYARAWREFAEGRGPRPETNIRFEVFRELAEKRTQVSVHTQVYQVVLMTITMIRVEFGLDVFIDHGEWKGFLTAPLAQALGVQAIIGPREIDTPSRSWMDTDGQILGIASEYQRRGHTMIGFNTDSPIVPEEQLFLQASIASRFGFDTSEGQALRGLTIVPATTAGIAERVGSLEVGKDADILVASGDPIDPRTSIERVFIEGRQVYDAARDGRRW
ncbi:MAG: amidohydrolase family protein [Planctomycetes bacterium]|nr:amidohydrolase family protein [Planctomycetota bacterium]